MRFTVSPPEDCAAFRQHVRESFPERWGKDRKQTVVDEIMARLETMHNEAEGKRKAAFEKAEKQACPA
jgi:hypothetical protein